MRNNGLAYYFENNYICELVILKTMIKKLFLISALIISSAVVSAQDWSASFQTQENGKTYTSYLTNAWRDNLYVGAAVGASTRFTVGEYSDIVKHFINPTFELSLLKWFTPEIGFRFGVMGFNGREGLRGYNPYQINHSAFPYKVDGTDSYYVNSSEPGTLYYGYGMFSGDFLWNITDTFFGYKVGRFHTASLYVSGGYLRMYDNKTENRGWSSQNNDREFVLGAGLYNTFRLASRLVATVDLRFSNYASRYKSNTGVRTNAASLNFGIAYNLYKTKWNNLSAVTTSIDEANELAREAEKSLAQAKEENESLNKNFEQLQTGIHNILNDAQIVYNDNGGLVIKSVSYEQLVSCAKEADLVVYFPIASAELNFSEIQHLTVYAQDCIDKDPDHIFYVTGSADKGTGKDESNFELSNRRALCVRDFLVEKFSVNPDNIVISNVVTDEHSDGAFDRCAIVESK